MEQQELYLLIARHFNGQTTGEEERFLEEWLQWPENRDTYHELESVWASSAQRNDDIKINTALRGVKERIQVREKKGLRVLFGKYGAAAAVAAMIAGVGFFFRGQLLPAKQVVYVELKSKPGEIVPCTLPDGTTVQLAPGSKIRYPESFADRKVILEGQAFFDVAKKANAPFAVQAGEVTVHVLGTKFNVAHYQAAGHTAVSLVDGKVQVQAPGTDQVELQPGQELRYDHTTHLAQKNSYDMESVTGWTTKLLVFRNDNLATVAARLEQLYDVHIMFDNAAIAEYKIFARFNNKPLSYILEVIKATDDVDYIVEGNTVRFTKTSHQKN